MLNSRLALILLAVPLFAADPDGAALYQAKCSVCHENSTDLRIPKRAALATRTPENVFAAMATGPMTVQATGLSADEERAIARYITAKEFSADNSAAAGQCAVPAKALTLSAAD